LTLQIIERIVNRFVLVFLAVLMIGSAENTACQDIAYARTVINKLCSGGFHGRGYAKNGDHRAAGFIRDELSKAGIRSFGGHYFQFFPVNVNIFPGKMKFRINGQNLVPGRDFLIDPSSPGLSGRYTTGTISTAETDSGNRALLLYPLKIRAGNKTGAVARVEITNDKLTFGISSRVAEMPQIMMNAGVCSDSIAKMQLRIKNRYLNDYRTQNVIGYIRGTVCPDSFVVFTAHYDHLGLMGRNTYFPGANDNASGVAMVLSLARYFNAHPQRFSIIFIFLSGEELGLLGSGFFTENSPIRLSAVKFLVNLDLVGTGSDGITVVNATEFPDQFEMLTVINNREGYVNSIKKRGSACNSDHCPFFRKGVPCFFIYTMGGIAAYHDPDDRSETLPLTAFEGLTRLLVEFCGSL